MRNLLASSLEQGLRLYSRVAPTERGGYRLARLARRARPRDRWRDTFQTPDGFEMSLDLGVYPDCCMALGLYELDTIRVIRRLLRPGDHVVDGGANIGYVTMIAARCIGPTGRVDAIEPEPHNRARLLDHLARNGLSDRVTVHPVALADQAGEASIHFHGSETSGEAGGEWNHGSSTLFADPAHPAEATRVSTVRLDDLLQGSSPRLIKLDIEGAESLAVQGMTRLLASDRPPLLVGELNPGQARRAGTRPSQWVTNVLEVQPAYRVYHLGWRPRQIPPDPDALDALGQVNVLLRPNST